MAVFPSWDPSGATWATTLLDEEFSGASLPSEFQAGWFAASGTSGPVNSQESVTYASANVAVSGGYCQLTLGSQGAIITSNPSNGGGATGFTMTAPFAYEWRVWLPGTTGTATPSGSTGLAGASGQIANWPAVWSTGQHWPATREIDCMEGLQGRASGHFIDGSTTPTFPGFYGPTTPGWHTFGVTLVNSRLSFYYDGVLMGSSPYTTSSDNSPHYLVADNTTGNGTYVHPVTMYIDWVRVWAPGSSGANPGGSGGSGGGGSTGGGATGGQPGGLSVVQSAVLTAAQITSNPAVLALQQPTVPGNCIVVCIGWGVGASGVTVTGVQAGTGTGTTFTGGSADNFAQLVSATSPVSGITFQQCAIWADPNCKGGQTQVQVTLSHVGNIDVAVYEVFGVAASAVTDQTATGSSTGTGFASGNAGNTGSVAEIAFGVASIFNTFNTPGAIPASPWTAVEPQGDLVNMCAGYQVIQPGGAAVSFAGTQDVSGVWAAAAVTLKSAQAATARPGRSLLVSLAPNAGTDGYGNKYPAGLQVGASTGPQVAIVPAAAGSAAEVQFPLPIPLSNVPNLAGGVAGADPNGVLLLSGPAAPNGGVGDDDWVQLVMWSDGPTSSARGEFRYIASGGAVTIYLTWDQFGLKLPATSAPGTPGSGCRIWYDGAKLWAKGPSGVAVALATT